MSAAERRILELALIGLETERTRIEQELADLRRRLRGVTSMTSQPATSTTPATPRTAPNKGRKMSAAQKKKISQAMKARYAAKKKAGL
jgi:chemotaxis regulatin CheY-phosphate phosphatase CheZ